MYPNDASFIVVQHFRTKMKIHWLTVCGASICLRDMLTPYIGIFANVEMDSWAFPYLRRRTLPMYAVSIGHM